MKSYFTLIFTLFFCSGVFCESPSDSIIFFKKKIIQDYSSLDSNYHYLKKAHEFLLNNPNKDFEYHLYYLEGTIKFYQKQYESSNELLLKARSYFAMTKNSNYEIYSLNTIALNYILSGKIVLGRKELNKVVNWILSKPFTEESLIILQNIGEVYYMLGDYKLSTSLLTFVYTKFWDYSDDNILYSRLLNLLAKSQISNGQYRSSLKTINEIQSILQSIKNSENDILIAQKSNLIINQLRLYLEKGSPKKAIEVISRNRKHIEKFDDSDSFLFYNAKANSSLGKTTKAINAFRDLCFNSSSKWIQINSTLELLKLYNKTKQYEEFTSVFETNFLNYFKTKSYFKIYFDLDKKEDLLEIFDNYISIVAEKNQDKNEEFLLKSCLIHFCYFQRICQITKESSSNLYSKIEKYLYDSMKTGFEFYSRTSNESIINELLFISKLNKSFSLKNINLIHSTPKIDSLNFNKEKLKKKLIGIRKEFKPNLNENSISIQDSIFKITEKLRIIAESIKLEKFDYFFEDYNFKHFSKHLIKGSTYIELYCVENSYFIFSITNKEVNLELIEMEKFLSRRLKNPRLILINQNTLDHAFSHQLYKSLIEPCLTEDTKYITFIPDGILSTIPIELLLTDPNDPTSYLVKKYAINYQYSAQLWVQSLTRKKRNDYVYDFAGFAPSFSGPIADNVRNCSGTELGYLSCNQNEVQNISQKINYATSLTGLDASLNNFEKIASKARILHLATHSCFELDNPDLSRIYFTDDYYATADLALMNLDNELTVLSACNTGYGAILPGEGVMSLAKGFFQANCHSLLTSQWSIDDCVTPKILEKYYHHLLQGERKDRALQLAKIEFLEENPGLQQHPYFWAGLVQYGDCSPIQFTQTPWQKAWPWLLLLLPLGGGLVWWQRKTA